MTTCGWTGEDVLAVMIANPTRKAFKFGVPTSTVRNWLIPFPTPSNRVPKSPLTMKQVLRAMRYLEIAGKVVCIGRCGELKGDGMRNVAKNTELFWAIANET